MATRSPCGSLGVALCLVAATAYAVAVVVQKPVLARVSPFQMVWLGVYADRRAAVVSTRAERGIDAAGDTGLGVWVPLADEAAAVRELLVQGWAVSPGERYRFRTAPGIRITTADLEADEAERLADAVATLGRAQSGTYAG